MSTTTYGNCLLFHGGGLCPLSNRYLSKLANDMMNKGIFEQIYMGFFSFESLLNPEEFIKPWNAELKEESKHSHGGFYGTSRGIDLTNPELQEQAIATCKSLGITWIGVAGGDGSCRQVAEISEAFEVEGIHLFIPMPLTIDGIEGGFSIGLQPAVNKSYEVLDDLAATNLQTRDNRAFSVLFLEVQGRNRDDILANLLENIIKMNGIAGILLKDIDLFVVPANYPYDINNLIEKVKTTKKRTVVLYSEGSNLPVGCVIEAIKRKTRISKVGYLSQMNRVDNFNERLIYDEVSERSVLSIAQCVKGNKSFALQFDDMYSSPKIKSIDYWAKLNPRGGQKPTLPKYLEELLKKYTPQ